MLTVLIGSNTAVRTKRLEALLSPLEKDGADIRHYTDVSFSATELEANAGSSSLFGGAMVTVVSGIGDSAAQREELEKLLPVLASSTQHFFISEPSLPAALVKKMNSTDATVEIFDEKAAAKKKETFNIFALTDAFAERKRTACWSLYRAALTSGLEVREVHSKLFWGVKTLLVAESADTPKEAGLHPFVFQKSKANLKNFAKGELAGIVHALTVLFHDATFSGKDMETELEALLLRSLEKPTA